MKKIATLILFVAPLFSMGQLGIRIAGNNVKCNGNANGSATANVSGGLQPYTYTWSNGSTKATVAGLSAGIYTLTVVDNLGSRGQSTITINEPAPLSVVIDSNVVQPCFRVQGGGVCGCGNSVWAIVSGGTGPYSYLWPLDTNATSDTISNVCYLEFAVIVTDHNGCTIQDSIDIVSPVTEGINEAKGESENVKVYPNPSNGVFSVEVNNEKRIVNSVTEIYNSLGQKVFSNAQIITSSNFQIDLSGQPAGIYLYRIVSETGDLVGEGKLILN